MRDIPLFTTEYGIASLTLSQIPYTKRAYIRIQDSCNPSQLLQDCISFCKMAGADAIHATGSEILQDFPEHASLISMQADRDQVGDTDVAIFPVTQSILPRWIEIYNSKVVKIPNGAWMTIRDGEKMLQTGDGYFVHRDGKLLGIGKASGGEISWVASVAAGAGADVVRALCHALSEDTVSLVVAQQNKKAVSLYEKLGFLPTRVISTWYTV